MVSPEINSNLMLSAYDKIIFLDTPPGYALPAYFSRKTNAKIYVPEKDGQSAFAEGLDCGRDKFGECFNALRKNQNLSSTDILSYYKLLNARQPIDIAQFIAGVMVFSELKLIKVTKSPFTVTVDGQARAELGSSAIYNYLCGMRE